MELSKYEQYPKWRNGVVGWDERYHRFRDEHGRRISLATYLEKTTSPEGIGGVVIARRLAPLSTELERIDDVVGGLADAISKGRTFRLLTDPPRKGWPMEMDILAAMRLSEYMFRTQGDVARAIMLPIELGLSDDFDIKSPSAELKKELEALYDVDQLDLYQLLCEVWLSVAEYGNCYPLVIPSGQNDSPLAGLTLLNPKYVYVGSKTVGYTPQGGQPSWSARGMTRYGLLSQTEREWTKEVLEAEIQPMTYNCFASGWNEQVPGGMMIDLNSDWLFPVTDAKNRWEPYAIPQLQKAMLAITTRKMAEELRRATFEGFKNQLFLFNVGTPEIPGSPKEVEILGNVLDSLAGERTGAIKWKGNLRVDVVTMASLDSLMAQDTWHGLTLHIFRQLGVPIKLISGESPTGGAAAQDEATIRVFIERLKFMQRRLLRWERQFRLRLAEMFYPNDSATMEAMRKTEVVFQKPAMEVESLIRGYLMPLASSGNISRTTLHEMAGLDHEVETARRKAEKEAGEDELFTPMSQFTQAVQTSGQTRQTEQSEVGGRPPNVVETQPRVEAAEVGQPYDPFSAAY